MPTIIPVTAATAGSPAAALALALAVPQDQPQCVAFDDDGGDHLCLLGVRNPDDGSVAYSLGLVRPRHGEWVVTAQINDGLGLMPEMNPVGKADAAVSMGDPIAVSPTERAIELVVEATWSWDEEGGHNRREELRILYWRAGDELIELVSVRSSGDSSAEREAVVTQSYQLLPSAEGAPYDLEVTTNTVRNSWPDSHHTDDTEVQRFVWTGRAYELADQQLAAEGEQDEQDQQDQQDQQGDEDE